MKKVFANLFGILTMLPLGLIGIITLGYSQNNFILIIPATIFCVACIGASLFLADKVMNFFE